MEGDPFCCTAKDVTPVKPVAQRIFPRRNFLDSGFAGMTALSLYHLDCGRLKNARMQGALKHKG
jgi:hypothetical protein